MNSNAHEIGVSWEKKPAEYCEFAIDWQPQNDATVLRRPGRAYTKRSSYISELRSHSQWAGRYADDDLQPPAKEAQRSAELFINSLPEGCLDFRLGVSHSGEINFFFGQAGDLFQVLIDEDGLLNYYGIIKDREFRGGDVSPKEFQYLKVLEFIDRKK
jgi:hypothetical protein